MKIALAQTNTTVGDLCGNTQKILSFAQRGAASGSEAVVFPELTLTGYPPRDLLEKQSFLEGVEEHLEKLASSSAALGVTLVVGTVTRRKEASGRPIYNTAAVIQNGRVVFRQHKMLLPSYDVFDETRYFEPAPKQFPLTLDGSLTALTICEDAWNDKQFWERRLYSRDPVQELARSRPRVLISINASPYHMGKRQLRREVFSATAHHSQLPIVYVNQVGGNDSLIFDGASMAVTADGKLVTRPADNGILRGITRTVVIGVIEAQNLLFEERPFTLEEAYAAREAFVTAASQTVMPVTRIDDRLIGDGKPGPVAKSLRISFHSHAEWS